LRFVDGQIHADGGLLSCFGMATAFALADHISRSGLSFDTGWLFHACVAPIGGPVCFVADCVFWSVWWGRFPSWNPGR
jgi:hypothetical protein